MRIPRPAAWTGKVALAREGALYVQAACAGAQCVFRGGALDAQGSFKRVRVLCMCKQPALALRGLARCWKKDGECGAFCWAWYSCLCG